jgi:hypothetical protein
MPEVGFEPSSPAVARAKTVHALDRAHSDPLCWFTGEGKR